PKPIYTKITSQTHPITYHPRGSQGCFSVLGVLYRRSRRDSTPRLTVKGRFLHNRGGCGRAGYEVLRNDLDEMIPKPQSLVLAQSWLWSNRPLELGLGGVPS
ncbi:unnamed protein product, partial [Ectocarpus sp. 12 AP-2014]